MPVEFVLMFMGIVVLLDISADLHLQNKHARAIAGNGSISVVCPAPGMALIPGRLGSVSLRWTFSVCQGEETLDLTELCIAKRHIRRHISE